MSKIAPKHQRAIFLGAGSAGVGVAKQLVEYFMKEGLSEDEARRRFYFVDSNVSAPKFPDIFSFSLGSFFSWLRGENLGRLTERTGSRHSGPRRQARGAQALLRT